MPEPSVVLVSAGITWAMRALPFAVLARLRRSAVVGHLSVRMPFGVMIMLALYTVRGAGQADTRAGLALAVAVAATLGLRLRWRNPLLSILGGTVVHVVLATTLG